MSLGWSNPLPIVLGPGPTDIEQIWRALRDMVGGEHGPGPEGGVEDLFRQQKATAIAGAERSIERAFLQLFPDYATDALPLWEELLYASGTDTEATLRRLLVLAWQAPDGLTTPHLVEALTDISEQLTIAIEDVDTTHVTIPGKHFGPDDATPYYGLSSPVDHISAVLPNYATRDIVRVTYTLASGETGIPADVTANVAQLFRRRLSSWQGYTLVQLDTDDGPGFFLDGGANGNSVLDFTAL